jgi:hypothetical protein
MIDNS